MDWFILIGRIVFVLIFVMSGLTVHLAGARARDQAPLPALLRLG